MNIKNLRQKPIQVMRTLAQILFFIVLPGLYVTAFAGLKAIVTGLYEQTATLSNLLPQITALSVTVLFTVLIGRFFCGWMCAFGAFGDFIYSISRKVMKRRIRVPEQVDAALKYVKYILLAFLVIIAWRMNSTLLSAMNPWDAFGMLFTVGKLPALSYVLGNLAPAFFLLLVIAILSFFVERAFCRYLCPMGAVFAITSKLRFTAIVKPTKDCGSCKACTKNCPMGIALYKDDLNKSAECINCFECVSVCPRKNVSVALMEKDVRPMVAGAIAVTAITGAYHAGCFATDLLCPGTVVAAAAQVNQGYADGTYEGSGTGFHGATTTVSVTVTGGKISDISLISTGDDMPFFNRAFDTVVGNIISTQSSEVDAVSGATYSSDGIIEAVANALSSVPTGVASSTTEPATGASTGTTTEDSTNTTSESSDSSASTESSSNSSDTTSERSFRGHGQRPERGSSSSDSQTDSSSVNSSSDTQTSTDNSVTSNTGNETNTSASSDTQAKSSTNSSVSSSKYQDGTYEGSGIGFHGATTTVSVTVSGGQITDISLVSTGDDMPFFNQAYDSVVSDIVSTQSSEVDAVSGATYSSNGIMSAVANALEDAVTASN